MNKQDEPLKDAGSGGWKPTDTKEQGHDWRGAPEDHVTDIPPRPAIPGIAGRLGIAAITNIINILGI